MNLCPGYKVMPSTVPPKPQCKMSTCEILVIMNVIIILGFAWFFPWAWVCEKASEKMPTHNGACGDFYISITFYGLMSLCILDVFAAYIIVHLKTYNEEQRNAEAKRKAIAQRRARAQNSNIAVVVSHPESIENPEYIRLV